MIESKQFVLELDLEKWFVPPMDDCKSGLRFTRKLELPFPPYTGLSIVGGKLDDCPDPLGLTLKDVRWDIDREVFIARTLMSHHGIPLVQIPDEINNWQDLGWKLGSFLDAYRTEDDAESEEEENEEDIGESEFNILEDELEILQKQPSRHRTSDFNKRFRSIIRLLVDCENSIHLAYAMHQTKCFFDDHELEKIDNSLSRKYSNAVEEFRKMSTTAQDAWCKSVRRYGARYDRFNSPAVRAT